MGPRAGLDGCEKSSPPPGFDPRTVQPVASCYPGPRYVTEPLKMQQSASRPFCHDTKISEEIRRD